MTEGSSRSFRVIERLGQGAFGAVYLAETEGTGLSRRVAIKVPHADRATPALLARLRDEARLLSLIRHRAIVRVDDLVELDGAWSVVMEYVEGCDLTELLADAPVPPRPALAIAAEVAQALHAAYHQAAPDGTPIKLLHRDIKPSNLRVTAAGEVKILDFGVARAEFEEREAHATRSVFGTTTYLAPERYHGEDSRAGDVYALGVTLFEMLTGVPPGKSAMDADRQPPGRKWADQWAWLGQVSPELRDLVAKMLAPEPQDRPSARDCARQLSEIRMALGGITLEDWAEKVVPPKTRVKPGVAPEEQGSLLIERSTSQQVAVARPTGPSWGLFAGLGVAAIVLVVVAGVGGAWWQANRVAVEAPVADVRAKAPEPLELRTVPDTLADVPLDAPEAAAAGSTPSVEVLPAADALTAPPVAEPEPPVVDAPAASEEPESASATTPSGRSSARGSTRSSSTSPSSSRSAAATATSSGTLAVVGEVQEVRISGSRGSVRQGAVPAGTYTVVAVFPSGESTELPGVVVGAGEAVTVRCSAVFKSCKAGGS